VSHPVVKFPDAVLLAVDYLRTATGVATYSRVPSPLPDTFIRVERLGGFRNTVATDRPRLDIECWAGTEEAAADLLSLARAYVGAMAGTRGATTVYNVVEVTGPQWLPDSATGHPRYAFAVEFSTRGTSI
jgi:hypothetical protein